MATSDLEIEGQGHKTIAFVALPIYTYIPNLKVLTKIFFKLSRPKGNLCGGDGVTVLNPKYPRLSSGDTIKEHSYKITQFADDITIFLDGSRDSLMATLNTRKFLWDNKNSKISGNRITSDYFNEGLIMIDLDNFIITQNSVGIK